MDEEELTYSEAGVDIDASEAATRNHDYDDPFPGNSKKTVGEVLLEPTRIYTSLLDDLQAHDVHAAAHVTGGGWTNLTRMGELRYEISDPFDVQPVFEFIQDEGNVSDEEMHRTFNMGTGFVVALDPDDAESLVEATDGRFIGTVEAGDEAVGPSSDGARWSSFSCSFRASCLRCSRWVCSHCKFVSPEQFYSSVSSRYS